MPCEGNFNINKKSMRGVESSLKESVLKIMAPFSFGIFLVNEKFHQDYVAHTLCLAQLFPVAWVIFSYKISRILKLVGDPPPD